MNINKRLLTGFSLREILKSQIFAAFIKLFEFIPELNNFGSKSNFIVSKVKTADKKGSSFINRLSYLYIYLNTLPKNLNRYSKKGIFKAT